MQSLVPYPVKPFARLAFAALDLDRGSCHDLLVDAVFVFDWAPL